MKAIHRPPSAPSRRERAGPGRSAGAHRARGRWQAPARLPQLGSRSLEVAAQAGCSARSPTSRPSPSSAPCHAYVHFQPKATHSPSTAKDFRGRRPALPPRPRNPGSRSSTSDQLRPAQPGHRRPARSGIDAPPTRPRAARRRNRDSTPSVVDEEQDAHGVPTSQARPRSKWLNSLVVSYGARRCGEEVDAASSRMRVKGLVEEASGAGSRSLKSRVVMRVLPQLLEHGLVVTSLCRRQPPHVSTSEGAVASPQRARRPPARHAVGSPF